MKYPLDNVLRPPYEIGAAVFSLCASPVVLVWHRYFGLALWAAVILATMLLAHSVWRGRQGWRIMCYRRGLERPRMYKLTPEQLPTSKQKVFLGRGFRWTGRHTQRWTDLQREMARRDAKESGVAAMKPADALVASELGGSLGMHGVELDEEDVHLNMSERPGHVLVIGTTRVGKSRLLEVLVSQDIHIGNVVIVLDPKGDLGVLQRMYAEALRAGRADNFYFFHLGFPELSARYNPIGDFTRVTEIADRIANGVPGGGSSDTFKQFVWHNVNGVMRAVVALGERPNYKSLRTYLNDGDGLAVRYLESWLDRTPQAQGWRQQLETEGKGGGDRELRERNPHLAKLIGYVQKKKLHDDVAESVIALVSHPRAHFEKLVASVKPLLEKLTNGRAGELISPNYADPNDPRPVFDWATVIANGGIVYVGLDALASTSVAGAVGTAMFADLTSIASRIYTRGIGDGQSTSVAARKLCIHADEFNELIGDEFIPMINKAGGAGFQVVAYTQTTSDIEAKIGNAAKARQIEGNFNTRIYMRILDDATSKGFIQRLSEVNISTLSSSSRSQDSNDPEEFADFGSASQDTLTTVKGPMLSAADLGQLPKGHAFALLNGGQLYKLRIPLMVTDGDPNFLGSFAEIAASIGSRYVDPLPPTHGVSAGFPARAS